MTQKKYLSRLSESNPDAVIIASLGKISTDLIEIGHKNLVPVRGAMGCVMGIGLGYALNTRKKVIVVIGEGSFLMKMGSMATILQHAPRNLSIIILNNGKFNSCGGQENYFDTVKDSIPFEVVEV